MIDSSHINYLCIDLDGTLLNSSKNIDEDTCLYLKQCMSKGLKIVLVSGRHYFEMIPYIKLLCLSSEDYVISCDGEYIYTCDGKMLWNSKKLSFANVVELWDKLDVETFSVITDKLNISVVKSFKTRLRSQIIGYITKAKGIYLSPKSKKLAAYRDIEKVIIHNKKVCVCDEICQKYCVHNLEEGRIEILPRDVNKYEAILALERLGGVDIERTVYFGNDLNDIECFENLNYTVAMEDSPTCITSRSSMVTTTCDSQGVLRALQQIFS